MTTATSSMHNTADRLSEESQPHSGRKGFLDMLWDGEIVGALQKGVATAGESLPMTLSAYNPYTMVLNAISMAGANYRENTLENPNIPAWKRASQAIGSAAIEQAVEKYADPIFKYVGGGKILRGASKKAGEKITKEVTKDATQTLAKRIYGRLKGLGKDAAGEGAEEVLTNLGNDILGEALDIAEGGKDYGVRAQWKKMKEENPDADLWDFAKQKAKENVEPFIGGALAGAYTSGTAQLSAKGLQYSFEKLGGGTVEENEGKPLDPINVDLAQSYDDGYSADEDKELNDTKNVYELRQERLAKGLGVDVGQVDETIGDPTAFIRELQRSGRGDEIQPVLDYVNAKGKYEGMIQRVKDDIDSRIEQSNTMVDSRVNHKTGMVQGATMKMQDDKGHDRRVYVLDGHLAMYDDGTGIDREKSDKSIIIHDAETGKMEMVPPDAILRLEEPVDPEVEKQTAADVIRQQVAQKEAKRIDGVVPFNPGDIYTLTADDGQAAQVQIVASQDGIVDNGDGTVNVSYDGGQSIVPMRKDEIQAMVDATNRARVAIEEQQGEAAMHPQQQYNLNDEITLQTDDGPVRGSITAGENEDGLIEVYTERPIGGKKINLYNRNQLDGMLVKQNGTNGADGNNGTDVVSATTDVIPGEPTDNRENISPSDMEQQPMPMIGEGEEAEPDFSKATPQRAHTYIYNEAGLDREEANQFVEANKKAADKTLTTIQGKKPKMGTSLAKYRKETVEWQQKVSDALAQADYWKQVKEEQQKLLAAEAQARAERDAVIHEQAIAEEQQRQEEELRKREAQAQLGGNNVAPQISEKWNAAPKVDGARNEIVLANGERVSGHYVLVESGAATPSHNPATGFAKNEGFPMDENEQSVNDRDYERDQDAQAITRQIADLYDSRAMQTPVVVSSDGVVLSGNGRTMAGELAAQNGTDGAYIEYLKKYGRQYGFTPEQVDGMAHPRVLFVPDEAMPYTADTFAKFNQQEMKGQSKTEQAVKLGKIVDNDTFGRIIRSINAYDTLSDFYSDPAASTNAIQELAKAGAISQAQYAEMFDGNTISSQGREMLENMLIGKAFESNPDAVREITAYKGVRQSVICALAEISNNLMLGKEYSLESELAQAIELVYQARYNGYKSGERVSSFARQLNLFPFDDGESVADYTNATVMMLADVLNDNRVTGLKKVLALYNRSAADAAAGQLDIFSGGVKTTEEIIKEVIELLNYGTKIEQQAALANAREQRKAAVAEQGETDTSVQQDGVDGGSGEGRENFGRSGGSSEETQTLNHDEAISLIAQMEERAEVAPEIELTIENWDAQFGEDGRVNTPIGEVKMGENQFAKLMRQGREGKLGMIKPTLESPDVIIEDASKAKDGDITERNSSYIFVKAFKKADGTRYYYFTSITVSKDGYEVVVSNQEKSRNRLLRLMTEGKMLWRTPKDATTASVEQQGLDYAQPLETETATKGSGITPQSTSMSPSESKGRDLSRNISELGEKIAEEEEKVAESQSSLQELRSKYPDRVFVEQHKDGSVTFHGEDALGVSKLLHRDFGGTELTLTKAEADNALRKLLVHGFKVAYYGEEYEPKAVQAAVASAEAETETNPTEAQKEAGNYKKGHVKIDGYDVTIENPKGSVRSGRDANGQEWSVTMNNTYGYIRGTEGVDGDHIDVFLSDDPTIGDVYVIDQVNPETGEFDEHKVMYGFKSALAAKRAYNANYSPGWQGLGTITKVSKEEFKKWIDSSHRKTKPFAEYKSVKAVGAEVNPSIEKADAVTRFSKGKDTGAMTENQRAAYNMVRGMLKDAGVPVEVLTDEQMRELAGMGSSMPEDGISAKSLFADIEYVNEKFNEDLQRQIDGTLPKGHIYQMGYAGQGFVKYRYP